MHVLLCQKPASENCSEGFALYWRLCTYMYDGMDTTLAYPLCMYYTLLSVRLSVSNSSIVQGADWAWGPAKHATTQPSYIRYSALVTSILAFILFFAYLVLQVTVHHTYHILFTYTSASWSHFDSGHFYYFCVGVLQCVF